MWDLLHGLMLPSGNDSAVTLAEHFGHYLYEVATRYKSNKATTVEASKDEKVAEKADVDAANTRRM